MTLSDCAGSWTGTNGFRLMRDDALAERPATISVTTAAAGHLTSVAYTWEHPEDGPQDGLLVIGAAGEDGALTALWGDSWHQKPEPRSLPGRAVSGGLLEFEADYGGGWRWVVVLDASDPQTLRMRMDNVIPADHAAPGKPAGPYPVMEMAATRA